MILKNILNVRKIIKIPKKIILILVYFYNFIIFYNRYDRKHPVKRPMLNDIYPCLDDKTENTGFDSHYIYHTAWASRKLKEINPKKHTDISSSLYFVSICSAFYDIDFYDFRPAPIFLSNLTSSHADILNLPFDDNSKQSLSCMHVLEHIGLGRYGDPIDSNADLKAAKELTRVLANGGDLLLVVPVGESKIMYNAHRVYSYSNIIEIMSELTLVEFSLIADDTNNMGILENSNEQIANQQNYGCGLFHFKKI